MHLCYDESMTLKTFWADSRGKVSVALVLLWLSAIVYHQFRLSSVITPLLAVIGSCVADALLSRVRYGAWFFSPSSLVTGLLIGLIVDPTSITMVFLAVMLASVSKYVVGLGRQKHIFNPAAFGIGLSSIVFNQPAAWWGAAGGIPALMIIAGGMLPALRQLRRLWMPISFLLVYGTWLALVSGTATAVKLTFDGTTFLFAWVIVTELITAPSRGLWRYGWGILVAILVVTQQALAISWIDPLLAPLLMANVIGFLTTRIP